MAAYVTMAVPYFFGFTMLAHASDLFWLLLPYLLAVIFFGMTVSCLVRYRENVMLLVVFTSVPLLFLTGASWPQSNIPGYWQGFSWLIPSTFGVRGYLRIASMGGTLDDILPEVRTLLDTSCHLLHHDLFRLSFPDNQCAKARYCALWDDSEQDKKGTWGESTKGEQGMISASWKVKEQLFL